MKLLNLSLVALIFTTLFFACGREKDAVSEFKDIPQRDPEVAELRRQFASAQEIVSSDHSELASLLHMGKLWNVEVAVATSTVAAGNPEIGTAVFEPATFRGEEAYRLSVNLPENGGLQSFGRFVQFSDKFQAIYAPHNTCGHNKVLLRKMSASELILERSYAYHVDGTQECEQNFHSVPAISDSSQIALNYAKLTLK